MVGRSGPRRSRRQARDAAEGVAQDGLGRRGCRQVTADLGPYLDNADRGLHQAPLQGVELSDVPVGALRHGTAQPPKDPVRPGGRDQPELGGDSPGAGGVVGGQVGLPSLDIVLGRATPTVKSLVERLGPAGQVGDDEARVGALNRLSLRGR